MNSHLRRKKRRAAERSWKRMQAMLKDVYGDAPLLGRRAGMSERGIVGAAMAQWFPLIYYGVTK